MTGKMKLELTWIGKDRRPRLEPRILIEDQRLSHHGKARKIQDIFDNILIHGDNLLALRALEQNFTGKIKCVSIDPPYNTGSAFEHYDDGVEHSIWLSMMRDRMEIVWRLLSKDGSVWVTLDDNECHYFKVMCDEIFGRDAYICSIIWENFYGRSNAAAISPAHNYILLYAKSGQDWKNVRGLLPRDQKAEEKYSNPDNDPRGRWRLGPIFAPEERHEGLMYEIITPSGKAVRPPRGSHWRLTEPDFWRLAEDGRITFGPRGDNIPAIKLYLSEVQSGVVPRTLWPHGEVGHSQEAKREIQALFPDQHPFDTPKPERLINRIIDIATKPGDIVLDSFAGSGTTGAVAHKMGRRWIMIELGDHCETHIVPRMNKVIDGEDSGGVTEAVGWQGGGGGYRYYRLAPSMLEKDAFGQWVISKAYNAEMLSEAMCKHFGFTYAPSQEHFWMQGHASETDYIYVTTSSLTYEQLRVISDEVGPERTLLICCKAFQGANADSLKNLTIRKIPAAVLDRCEWGKDDYSLKIENLPMAADEEPEDSVSSATGGPRDSRQASLFEDEPSA